MKISIEVLTKVKDINIIDVISKQVPLKHRGANYLGLCPFHNEKTPSFTVSPSKGIYKCFGCGKSGDVISFIEESEGFSFPEAVKHLCSEHDIEITENRTDQEKKQDVDRESICRLNKIVCDIYEEELHTTENKSMRVFTDRGYSEDTIAKFCLGHANSSFSLAYDALAAQKTEKQIMIKSCLVRQKKEKFFDFFINRAMFPIHNRTGKIVGFGGRKIDETDMNSPKYLNTPDTLVFNKSNELYGLFFAKKEIMKQNRAIVVEGYTDVISMHQAGIENTVASSGTALTKQQVRQLKRFTNNIDLLYDGDDPGLKAIIRAIDIVMSENMGCRVILLSSGHDPDSYMREFGKDEFLAFLQKSPINAILYKVQFLKNKYGDGPENLANIAKEVMATIRLVPDVIKREVYTKKLSNMIEVSAKALANSNYPTKRVVKKEDKEINIESDIVRILFEYGDKPMKNGESVRTYILNQCPSDYFNDVIVKAIIKMVATETDIPVSTIKLSSEDHREYINSVLSTRIQYDFEKHEEDVRYSVSKFKLSKIERFIDKLIAEMKEVVEVKDKIILQKKIKEARDLKGSLLR